MNAILLWFILNNLLFTFSLYFYNPVFSKVSFIFILFFSLLWLSIKFIRSKLITEKTSEADLAMISFAVNIGYKFVMSLFFLGFTIYVYQEFNMKYSILFFVLFYFIYTVLIAKFGKENYIK